MDWHTPRPGGKGQTHEVILTADGYDYQGERYESLSPIGLSHRRNTVVGASLLRNSKEGVHSLNSDRSNIRCTIYTHKSSEEALDQSFNSLPRSIFPPEKPPSSYSATSASAFMRPGLKRLLADIYAGRIDTVVVYKVDRLTRSLVDFAKIVESLTVRALVHLRYTAV
jgi:hypothetical protein